LRKTLAQQSCLQLKGPVRRYRPDAEAPDAPCGSPSFRSVNGIPCASDPGCRPAQRKFRTSRMPSRADVRGEFFFALVMFHSHWSQAADQYPDLSNRVRAAASSTYTIPTLNHISPWASLCRPVNGLGALISLIFGVNGPSRGGALAFVNASEAGVPDQPMAPLLSVTGVSPNCRRRACVRSSLLGQGRRARSVGCRGSCVFQRIMYLAAFFLIGNVPDLSGDRELVGPNSGRERNSLIRAEISLIADLNSLQGRKKFPVRMRRELARKVLI
jgi:hypothetical protein